MKRFSNNLNIICLRNYQNITNQQQRQQHVNQPQQKQQLFGVKYCMNLVE